MFGKIMHLPFHPSVHLFMLFNDNSFWFLVVWLSFYFAVSLHIDIVKHPELPS